jgi:putative SOS response-associated peptidase YedK
MCARYSLKSSAIVLQDLFDLDEVPELPARYNIAPTQAVPAVIQNDEGKRELRLLQFGLIPSWAKDPKIGTNLINARCETIVEKPAFRAAFKRRRCLIPADGFYEWTDATAPKSEELSASGLFDEKPVAAPVKSKARSDTYRQPYLVRMKNGQPFAFAGLWEHWETSEGGPIESFAIITTEPNEIVGKLHNRMPAILKRELYSDWLSKEEQSPEILCGMLKPYDANQMEAFPVTRKVGNPRFESPECILPLAS